LAHNRGKKPALISDRPKRRRETNCALAGLYAWPTIDASEKKRGENRKKVRFKGDEGRHGKRGGKGGVKPYKPVTSKTTLFTGTAMNQRNSDAGDGRKDTVPITTSTTPPLNQG